MDNPDTLKAGVAVPANHGQPVVEPESKCPFSAPKTE